MKSAQKKKQHGQDPAGKFLIWVGWRYCLFWWPEILPLLLCFKSWKNLWLKIEAVWLPMRTRGKRGGNAPLWGFLSSYRALLFGSCVGWTKPKNLDIFWTSARKKIYKPTPPEGKTRPIWWIPRARLNVGGKGGQTGDQLLRGCPTLLRGRLAQGAVERPAYPCVDLVAPWDTAPPSGNRNSMHNAK